MRKMNFTHFYSYLLYMYVWNDGGGKRDRGGKKKRREGGGSELIHHFEGVQTSRADTLPPLTTTIMIKCNGGSQHILINGV